MTTKQETEAYCIVTNGIIEQLEQNIVPWQMAGSEAGYPRNLINKVPFRGMNVWRLASLGYQQNYFVTYKQLKELGGTVRSGEKGHIVAFWKPKQTDVFETEEKAQLVFGYYMVYNIAQCDGLLEVCEIPQSPYSISSFGAGEEILEMMPNRPVIKHTRQKQGYYNPVKDFISMPKPETFPSTESYYSALFPILIHSTGHGKKLNRKGIVENPEYVNEAFSQEKLVAEIGACLLGSATGIQIVNGNQSDAYIKGWLETIQQNPRMVVYASFQAQKAVEYILNVNP